MKSITIIRMRKKAFVLVCCFLLIGCSRIINAPTYQNMTLAEQNGEITGEEKNKLVGDVSDTIYDTFDRSGILEEPIVTGVIEKSGMEIHVPEGRYTIFAGTAGNVFIYDENGKLLIRETFDNMFGVHSLTLAISEKHTIFFDGGLEGGTIDNFYEPPPNELSPGIWEVGMDIGAGDYTFSVDSGVGYVQVFERGKDVRVFELIGGEASKSMSNIQLVEGQKLKLTGAYTFHYDKKK